MSREITRILQQWTEGDQTALERLTPLVFDELHRLAHRYMVGEQSAITLETSGLVNEAFLRLVDVKEINWRNRAHFFAISATLMRQILVDFARNRKAQKRGGEKTRIPVHVLGDVSVGERTDLVALDDALQSLAKLDGRQCRVVELRFFGGLTIEETAEALDVSPGTVRRDWRMAKAWLYRELSARNGLAGPGDSGSDSGTGATR